MDNNSSQECGGARERNAPRRESGVKISESKAICRAVMARGTASDGGPEATRLLAIAMVAQMAHRS